MAGVDALDVASHAAALRELGGADGALEGLELHVADHVGLELGGKAEPLAAHLAVVPPSRRLAAVRLENMRN